jgi:hypothetical protein
VSVDGAPTSPGVSATSIDGRILALAGSPLPEKPVYGVMRRGLVDVSTSDHRPITFERATTAVVYVG